MWTFFQELFWVKGNNLSFLIFQLLGVSLVTNSQTSCWTTSWEGMICSSMLYLMFNPVYFVEVLSSRVIPIYHLDPESNRCYTDQSLLVSSLYAFNCGQAISSCWPSLRNLFELKSHHNWSKRFYPLSASKFVCDRFSRYNPMLITYHFRYYCHHIVSFCY